MGGPLSFFTKAIVKTGRLAVKKSGNHMGGVVKRDIDASYRYLEKQMELSHKGDFMTYHDKKLHDLVTNDSGVSADWIKELIADSKSPEQLGKVLMYLKNTGATQNLAPGVKRSLFHSAGEKLQAIQDKELLIKMAEFLRAHGGDLF